MRTAPVGVASLQAGGGLLIATPIVPFGGFQNPEKQLFAQPVKKIERSGRRLALRTFVFVSVNRNRTMRALFKGSQ
jgi:hypothetical protein